MKKNGRSNISGLTESQFEQGSNETVPKNIPGITDPAKMAKAWIIKFHKADRIEIGVS